MITRVIDRKPGTAGTSRAPTVGRRKSVILKVRTKRTANAGKNPRTNFLGRFVSETEGEPNARTTTRCGKTHVPGRIRCSLQCIRTFTFGKRKCIAGFFEFSLSLLLPQTREIVVVDLQMKGGRKNFVSAKSKEGRSFAGRFRRVAAESARPRGETSERTRDKRWRRPRKEDPVVSPEVGYENQFATAAAEVSFGRRRQRRPQS